MCRLFSTWTFKDIKHEEKSTNPDFQILSKPFINGKLFIQLSDDA